MRYFLIVICTLFLAACSSHRYNSGYGIEKVPAVYTVKKGDTLFSISWRFGVSQSSIMRANGITNPNRILIGQQLRFANKKVSRTPSSRKRSTSRRQVSAPVKKYGPWVWPIKGAITSRFNAGRIGSNGIRIEGKRNQTVNAAEGGTVVYTGNGLNGYGNVIIIKHRSGMMSAYGFLSKTFVRKGQRVAKKQKIGSVGFAANNKRMLHFEVRKNGQPVNPLAYIGSSYHF